MEVGVLIQRLAQSLYYGEEVSDQELKDQVAPDIPEDEFESYVKRFTGVLSSIAAANMDFKQLEAFLTSQMKKRENPLTEEQARSVTKFWKSQKGKVHEALVKQSAWENQLKSFNWRIDVKSKARHIADLNTPTAIVEMEISGSKGSEVVRFEMNEEGLAKMIEQIETIEEQITAYTT